MCITLIRPSNDMKRHETGTTLCCGTWCDFFCFLCSGAAVLVIARLDDPPRTAVHRQHGDPSHTTSRRASQVTKRSPVCFDCPGDGIVWDQSDCHVVELKTARASCEPSHSGNRTSGTGCLVLENRAWFWSGGGFLTRVDKYQVVGLLF